MSFLKTQPSVTSRQSSPLVRRRPSASNLTAFCSSFTGRTHSTYAKHPAAAQATTFCFVVPDPSKVLVKDMCSQPFAPAFSACFELRALCSNLLTVHGLSYAPGEAGRIPRQGPRPFFEISLKPISAEFGRDRISRYVQFVFSFRERETGRAVSERSLCNARSRQRASLNRARRIISRLFPSSSYVRSWFPVETVSRGLHVFGRLHRCVVTVTVTGFRSTSQAQAVVLIDLQTNRPRFAHSLTTVVPRLAG